MKNRDYLGKITVWNITKDTCHDSAVTMSSAKGYKVLGSHFGTGSNPEHSGHYTLISLTKN